MTDETQNREQGVEFGDLADELESHDYPATASELVADYGDYELGLPNGEETFEETLGPLAESDNEETYESAEEVEQTILNMVGSKAVGREGYSDRGTSSDPTNDEDQESL